MSQVFEYTRENIIADNPIKEIVERYGVVLKQHGAEFVGLCPLHKEKTPSFRVHPEKRVFKCFGCNQGGSVIDFVMKMENLSSGDAMKKLTPEHRRGTVPATDYKPSPERTVAPPTHPEQPTAPLVMEKVYDYKDATGKLVYQVVRFVPKTFRQRHPDPQNPGKWVWGMTGVERVLYNLPRVLKSQLVIVTEGEKDADNLNALGFTATCNVGGAGKWMDGYTESLADKEILLCGDSDEPGIKHMELVLQSLAGKVKTVRVVRLPSGFKDVSEYLATLTGEPSEKAEKFFNELVNPLPIITRGVNLPVYSMEEMEQRYSEEVRDGKSSIIELGSWLPKFYAIRGLMPGELVVILADTGVGKTMLMQNLAVSVAPLPTVIFELELPDTLTFERFVAIGTRTAAKSVYELYKGGRCIDWRMYGGRLKHIHVCPESGLSPDQIEEFIVKSELKTGTKPKLICVDYAQLVQSKKAKNRYERMSDVAEQMKVIAKRTKTVVVLLSQVGRSDEPGQEVGLHDAKDSGAIENSAGLIIGAWRGGKEDPMLITLKVLKSTKGGAGLTVHCDLNGDTLQISQRPIIDPADVPRN